MIQSKHHDVFSLDLRISHAERFKFNFPVFTLIKQTNKQTNKQKHITKNKQTNETFISTELIRVSANVGITSIV